jgi:5'-deoxynucleotidase YfbR-like HD superfamily hydrolase
MADISFDEIQTIYDELVIPFYKVKRDMYVPGEQRRQENDAEHSWSLAFVAFMLAPSIDKSLDMPKTVLYAITHDLVEIYSGDTSVWAPSKEHESKEQREAAALNTITKKFKSHPQLAKYLMNYQKKADPEACFIYALDKFHNWMTVLQGKDAYYSKYNKIEKSVVDEKLAAQQLKAATHPKVGRYFNEIIKTYNKHPEYFYERTSK